MEKEIYIKDAAEHNLKNIDVTIPHNKLTVVTGLSGSGKSSLAFDTIYAEGQRRYVESLSTYARQFLEQMKKPKVKYISGLSPAISIEQKSASRNPRSTVGTITEIHDYLRLLFSNIGVPHCPNCGKQIHAQPVSYIVDQILNMKPGTKIQVLSPVIRGKKGTHQNFFTNIVKEGFLRVRVDGNILMLEEEINLDKNKKHNIEIVIDRLIIKEGIKSRLSESIELAVNKSGGLIMINFIDTNKDKIYSTKFACPECDINFPEISTRIFSFNSPFGACPDCHGLGYKLEIDPYKIIPDPSKTIMEGAIHPWRSNSKVYLAMLESVANHYKFSLETPFEELSEKIQNVLLYGSGQEKFKIVYIDSDTHYSTKRSFEGVVNNLKRRYRQTSSQAIRDLIERYMSNIKCTTCEGHRLRPETLSILIAGKNIFDVEDLSIEQLLNFLKSMKLNAYQKKIAKEIIKELNARLNFLVNVGLTYLTLNRTANTLSGGETQRIRLATQIGSGLVGVLYVLDEPSIGLHQKDNRNLINTLLNLKELGNTLIVVEHDQEMIERSDYIVDLGPGAGAKGGNVVYQGATKSLLKSRKSLTAKYLRGEKEVHLPKKYRSIKSEALELIGATKNNLKSIDVRFPLRTFICVTGVSGSGKSSLINETLYPLLKYKLYRRSKDIEDYKKITGLKYLDKVINIDQNPIGRTPRSNPATYTGLFTYIRELFSKTKLASIRGYKIGRFSFNVRGGRCANCQGDGIIKIEMHFLPDIYVPCEVCNGKRYNRETLEVKYKNKNIADILDMTVDDAYDFFKKIPKIEKKLRTLKDVGLGYIKLGQSATTLSGGEAQRIKLSSELSKRATGNTIYLLDEPTTGLHFADIDKLIKVLQTLVDRGNTVIIIEHNLDVIKNADYIIDLGPEGGHHGGKVVFQGSVKEIVKKKESYTGQYLKKILK